MQYKLIDGSRNDLNQIRDTVLENRGIDIKKYTHLNDSVLNSYSLFPNIYLAVDIFLKHCQSNNHIHIIVDSDVDGYTSGAVMYQYIENISPQCKLTYSLHSGKQHGLTDDELVIPIDTDLLIIPDAGSNDVKPCMMLKAERPNLDILILDHHEIEEENSFATVVNNQITEYPNKQLSGVGVVYKFLQAVDDTLWQYEANKYLDLVALGNISDMMDIREYETKYLCSQGLKKIHNNCFKALIIKQSNTIHNEVNIRNVQFYIVPLLNALIRIGDMESKELLFKALIGKTEYFNYVNKDKQSVRENIYTRVARLCINAKAKQKRMVDKAADIIIDNYPIDTVKTSVMFINATNNIRSELTGLMANKLANIYKRPCLILMERNNGMYSGSGRNITDSFIPDLQLALNNTNCFENVLGHKNAFGLRINKSNISTAIKELDKKYPYSKPITQVDFEIDSTELTQCNVIEIDNFKKYCGQGISEPKIAILNVPVDITQFQLMGKLNNCWKFVSGDDITFVKFNVDPKTDMLIDCFSDEWGDNQVNINLIGTCSINYYKGVAIPQIIIEDYEVVN